MRKGNRRPGPRLAPVIHLSLMGLALLASVARWAQVDAPIAQGLLAIVGAFLGRDLRRGERSFEALGLAGLSRGQLQQMLHDGE